MDLMVSLIMYENLIKKKNTFFLILLQMINIYLKKKLMSTIQHFILKTGKD